MGTWSESRFTEVGRRLQAKIEAGLTTLKVTRMAIGSGLTDESSISAMTELGNEQMSLTISDCKVDENDPTLCIVTAVASSMNAPHSFLVSEMGLFAMDPDDGEILYMAAVDTSSDTMPGPSSTSPVSISYRMGIVFSDAESITAAIDPEGLVTVKILENTVAEHSDDKEAHPYLLELIQKMQSTIADMQEQIKALQNKVSNTYSMTVSNTEPTDGSAWIKTSEDVGMSLGGGIRVVTADGDVLENLKIKVVAEDGTVTYLDPVSTTPGGGGSSGDEEHVTDEDVDSIFDDNSMADSDEITDKELEDIFLND